MHPQSVPTAANLPPSPAPDAKEYSTAARIVKEVIGAITRFFLDHLMK
jgi:hypothetical protein